MSAPTVPFSWSVSAPNGDLIGSVTADYYQSKDGSAIGVKAYFHVRDFNRSHPSNMKHAAQLCGGDHFNWYQIATFDSHPTADWVGNPCPAPYIDPPPLGYGPSEPSEDDVQWADRRP